jgi:undecaprenyl-diphosphatase
MRIQALKKLFFNAIDFDHAQQTFLGLWGVVLLILFFVVLILIINQIGTSYINVHAHNFFTADRNPLGNKFFTVITMLGNMTVILSVTGVITLGLLIKQNWHAAKYLLSAMISTIAVVYILQIVTNNAVNTQFTSSAFPSQHVVYAIVFYGFISHLATARFEQRYHYMALAFSALLTFIIAVSRLYFDVHWLSDIIGSTLLGLILVLGFIILYRRRPHAEIDLRWFIPVVLISFLIIFGIYAWQHYHTLFDSLQPAAQNSIPVLMPGPVLV